VIAHAAIDMINTVLLHHCPYTCFISDLGGLLRTIIVGAGGQG